MNGEKYVKDVKLVQPLFSDGWIRKLQRRHMVKPCRMHGEAASAPQSSVVDGRAALQAITSDYSSQDVFNIDESAYFYCMALSTSVSKASILSRECSP